MRDSLKISLEKLRQHKLKDLFLILEEVFAKFNIRYYVLGALARDIWYAKEKIRSRATRDVDFAVYVFSDDQYKKITKELVDHHHFYKIKDVPFRLRTPFNYTIDLIPFGGISIDEKVTLDESWDNPVFVNGFEEIFNRATVQAVDDETQLQFQVASLSAIVLLKLIAYDDRPKHRSQDPKDIAEIIKNFFEIESEIIYEEHSDLFNKEMELHDYSAIVIGRQIRDIFAQNKELKKRVLNILSLENRTQKQMVEAMSDDETTAKQAANWIQLMAEEIQKS